MAVHNALFNVLFGLEKPVDVRVVVSVNGWETMVMKMSSSVEAIWNGSGTVCTQVAVI